MRTVPASGEGRNAGAAFDFYDKLNAQPGRKHCFAQQIPGADAQPLVGFFFFFFPGLDSVPFCSVPLRRGLLPAAAAPRLRVPPPAERFVLCRLCGLHAPDQPIRILRDWDTQREKRGKGRFPSASASVVLYSEFVGRSNTSITAPQCMSMSSFPS